MIFMYFSIFEFNSNPRIVFMLFFEILINRCPYMPGMGLTKKDCVFEVVKNGSCENIVSSPLVGFHSAILFNKKIQDAANNGKLMAELQIKAASFYDLYILFNFMDLTLEPEALGAKVFWDGGVPSVGTTLPYENAEETLENGLSSFLDFPRIKANLDAVNLMHENLEDVLIAAYVSGPLTLLSQTFGVTKVLKKVKRDPEHIVKLMEMASRIVQLYIDALMDSSAELIMILEPVGALLSPRMFDSTVKKFLMNLAAHINKRGILSALHICGDTNHLLNSMLDTGVHILSIDKQVDIAEPLKRNEKIISLGNVGTVELQTDTAENVYKISMETLQKTQGIRHILSSGCDVPAHSKPENIKMIVKAARDWAQKR